jgi:hypothetical protein
VCVCVFMNKRKRLSLDRPRERNVSITRLYVPSRNAIDTKGTRASCVSHSNRSLPPIHTMPCVDIDKGYACAHPPRERTVDAVSQRSTDQCKQRSSPPLDLHIVIRLVASFISSSLSRLTIRLRRTGDVLLPRENKPI